MYHLYVYINGHNSPQSTVTKTQGSAFGSHGLLTVLLGNVRILWGPWFVLSKFQKRRVKAEHCPVLLTTGDRRSGATWSFVLLGQWLTFRLWGFTMFYISSRKTWAEVIFSFLAESVFFFLASTGYSPFSFTKPSTNHCICSGIKW